MNVKGIGVIQGIGSIRLRIGIIVEPGIEYPEFIFHGIST
jgi:hypothetical protein